MRVSVGWLGLVAASSASAFAPQSSFVGRAPALRSSAPATAPRDYALSPNVPAGATCPGCATCGGRGCSRPAAVSRNAIKMEVDSLLVAIPGLAALGVALQNQMKAGGGFVGRPSFVGLSVLCGAKW